MTNSSFTGYARGEGFRPYKAPYDFLARQQQQDAETIRNLQQQKQEFDRRAAKSESDMARAYDKSEANLAENQRIEDLYFANRAEALATVSRRELKDIKTEGENEVKRLKTRQSLAEFAPKLLDSAIKIKEGIDAGRLEAATLSEIASIMPGRDAAYSIEHQQLRDEHAAIQNTADAFDASGAPQRTVTFIRNSSTHPAHVQLRQSATNLEYIYSNEAKRRVLERIQDPTNPHEVAYAYEAVQIELLKEHGLYGYSGNFLGKLYNRMRNDRNNAIQDAEYKRDLLSEQQAFQVYRDAALTKSTPDAMQDLYNASGDYRHKDGHKRTPSERISAVTDLIAENPGRFPVETIVPLLKSITNEQGEPIWDRMGYERKRDFLNDYAERVKKDTNLQKGLFQAEEFQEITKARDYFQNQWDGSHDEARTRIDDLKAKGFNVETLMPFLDRSNEARASYHESDIRAQEILKSNRLGDLEGFHPDVVKKYKSQIAKKNAEISAGFDNVKSEVLEQFTADIKTVLQNMDKSVVNATLPRAKLKALDMFYKEAAMRRAALPSNQQNEEGYADANRAAFNEISSRILNKQGDFQVESWSTKGGEDIVGAYMPAFVPRSAITDDGKLRSSAVPLKQDYALLDPKKDLIFTPQRAELYQRQIEAGEAVQIPEELVEFDRAHPGVLPGLTAKFNRQMQLSGKSGRIGPDFKQQLRQQAPLGSSTGFSNLFDALKPNDPKGAAIALNAIAGYNNPDNMSPRVAQAYEKASNPKPNSGGSLSKWASTNLTPEEQALLRTIRFAEGTDSAAGYNTMFTFKKFSDMSRHPRMLNRSGGLVSDAAGAYQYLSTTWQPYADGLNLKDFSPESQDKVANYHIKKLGVDPKQLLTREMLDKLSGTWASLPKAGGGSQYAGQTAKTADRLLRYYSNALTEIRGY